MKPVHKSQTRLLQRAFFRSAKETNTENNISRRDFLRKAATGASVLSLSPATILSALAGKKIVIIGAGLAGLTAAYTLKKAGIKSTVYEGSSRVGGRTYSVRNYFGDDLATDIGGEFVDEWHEDLLNMATEFGVETYDLRITAPNLPEMIHYGGKNYTVEDISKALQPFTKSIAADLASLPEDLTYHNAQAYQHFDNVSIRTYLENKGLKGWILELMCDIFRDEYGMDATEQTTMNMFCVLNLPEGEEPTDLIGGPGSEVLKVKGGTMSIAEKLAEKVKRQIKFKSILEEIRLLPDKRYEVSFRNGHSTKADYVIVAIPFTKLREVKLDFPMQERKRKAIQELGYGNSAKLILGFDHRHWNETGHAGLTITDLPYASGWDSSVGQPGTKGSLTHFTGGKHATQMSQTNPEECARNMLSDLEKLYPGISAAHNKKVFLFPWEKNEFSKAGYASYTVGQWSAFAGVEGEPEGNVLFAGEHASFEFQGFMNGAIETGRIAAEMVLKSK